eukprot:51205-Chlamydomonas_euryale.AAC.2
MKGRDMVCGGFGEAAILLVRQPRHPDSPGRMHAMAQHGGCPVPRRAMLSDGGPAAAAPRGPPAA